MSEVRSEGIILPTASPFVLRDFGRRDTADALPAVLYTPATPPPWPAAVVSEGLGGLKAARERRYGRFLAEKGFLTLVVDSFAARGFAKAPHPIRAVNVTESMMVADAFAGLTWFAERPDVIAERIYNIGFSYGGMICLLTAYEQIRRTFVRSPATFAAHVSYYGPTVPRLEDYRTTGAPVAILNGALDDNMNRDRLELIAGDLANGGSTVENVIFEGTYHQWDSDDVVIRFDRHNIRALRTRIDPGNTIIDERTGRVISNFQSRLYAIVRSVSLKGFYLKRDEDVMRRTDELLMRYLAVEAPVPRETAAHE